MSSYTATVAAAKVAATASNFRAWVDLSSYSFSSAQMASIRVYTDSGLTTEIPREIIGTTGFWCKIPSLTTSTVLYIEIDGTSSDYAVTDTYGRNNVWTGYLMVNHDIANDSTANGYNFAAGGGATLGGAAGVAGAATALDGVNDYAVKSYESAFNFGTGDATMEVIVKSPNSGALQHLLTYGNRDSWTTTDSFCMEITSGDAFNSKIRPSSSGAEVTGGSFSTDTWYKVKAVADRDGNLTLYVNGVAVNAVSISSLSGGSLNEATVGFIFGANNGLSTFAELTGCEFRVKTSIDSDHGNLEETEYNCVMDNGTFWTIESAGGGVTVNPSVQTTTFSLPSYTVATGSVSDLSVQTATFSLPSASVTLPKTVSVSTQELLISIPTYTIDAGGNIVVAAGVLEDTFSLPTYTVTAVGNTSIAAAVQAVSFSLPTTTITTEANQVISATVLSATFSIPEIVRAGGLWTPIPAIDDADEWSAISRLS